MAPSATRLAPRAVAQMVEYIPDRLYLGAFAEPPAPETPLPLPLPPAGADSEPPPPRKRPHRAPPPPCYFTVDDALLYNAFHHDFGPLHIGHLYRFAIRFHDILGARENKDRPVVFWSAADPRSRANAACMLACYMVLIQNWPPHLALAPIAQVDPPLMPFRDAGYSQADYGISVQDVVYGVWKAKEERCCDLDNFDLELYERFERVEHGDFNWITPHFLAFASPQHSPVARVAEGSQLFHALPRDLAAVDAHAALPQPFKNVLRHFSESNIGLVVRLNSPLYSPSYFEALGIQHLDMIFDDGTCPPLAMVRRFIRLAHETITVRKKAIAVHCKAGLGRTGCLIGAYLIYRHGFTANEIISFMRFMRPGMVVGPQQHWLHLNQGTFREWWIEERVERRLRRELATAAAAAAAASSANPIPSTPIRAMQKASLRNGQASAASVAAAAAAASTPPNRSPSTRTPLSEMDHDHNSNGSLHDDYLPAPTPGQPRKTARTERHHPYQRTASVQAAMAAACTTTTTTTTTTTAMTVDEEPVVERETDVVTVHSHSESDEELHLRMRSQRKAACQPSPGRGDRARAASQTLYVVDNDSSRDAENIGSMRAKLHHHPSQAQSQGRVTSTSGVLAKVRGNSRRAAGPESPLRAKDGAGVRKTSGRVGSANTAASAAAASVARKVSGS